MTVKPSLVVAVVAFAGVIVVIAVDTAYSVETDLAWQDASGTWRVIDGPAEPYHAPVPSGANTVAVPANGSVTLRFTVTNDRPLPLDRDVRVIFDSYAGNASGLHAVDARVGLDAFGTRAFTFTLDAEQVLPAPDGETEPVRPKGDGSGQFFITVGPDREVVHVTFREVSS